MGEHNNISREVGSSIMAFFDKVGATLSSFGNDVSSKTKNMVEVSNLNGQLKNCEDSLKMYYSEIGRVFFAKECENPDLDQELLDLFAKVKEAQEAIEHLQTNLRRAKGTKMCQACKAEVPIETLFCPTCGVRIDDNAECNKVEEPAESCKCPQCNADIKADATFCVNCGTKIS